MWIEINVLSKYIDTVLSPSTRRVWIEIKKLGDILGGSDVTLHTEGVD